jgi:hypothetical protein
MPANNFYTNQPQKAFWRPSVSEKHLYDLENLWQPIALQEKDRIATAGSCFAQHIGRNMKARGADYMDLEPPPPIFDSAVEANKFGFNLFSCRYGNIYTSRQLLQLIQEAFGERSPVDPVWGRAGRFFDAIRPNVDPVGHDTYEHVVQLRKKHLARVREMFETLDLFVFTMGLTEGWESKRDETIYPSAPGAICGGYDEARYAFKNLRYPEIYSDMQLFWKTLKAVNPGARMLLTVSPVPLVATATEDHVLVATTYSKSVLRAVAGDLQTDLEDVTYFPSYEIIATHPTRGTFFNRDLRSVNQAGVDYVMTHFFKGSHLAEKPVDEQPKSEAGKDSLICDEEALDVVS